MAHVKRVITVVAEPATYRIAPPLNTTLKFIICVQKSYFRFKVQWYSAGPLIHITDWITVNKNLDILDEVLSMNSISLLNTTIFQYENGPTHTAKMFSFGLRSIRISSNIFPGQHNRQTST